MSYSFNVKAESKTAAVLAAEAAFAKMKEQQPAHEKDEAAAFANVREHLKLVRDPNAGEEVIISMYGSLAIYEDGIRSAGSGCNVYIQPVT